MKRYWYHLSTKLDKRDTFVLIPWGSERASNRPPEEPEGNRIPVAPTIAQCIVALPLWYDAQVNVYRTEKKMEVDPPINVFDADITEEGWITKPTEFRYIGKLDFNKFRGYNIDYDVCCADLTEESKRMLEVWKEIKPENYITQ